MGNLPNQWAIGNLKWKNHIVQLQKKASKVIGRIASVEIIFVSDSWFLGDIDRLGRLSLKSNAVPNEADQTSKFLFILDSCQICTGWVGYLSIQNDVTNQTIKDNVFSFARVEKFIIIKRTTVILNSCRSKRDPIKSKVSSHY